jgi:hypothetical protein
MTDSVITKLEQAFAIDATVLEACSYAEISSNTFYEYLKRNPEFQDRIDELRQRPILKARQTIVTALTQPEYAMKYLERKAKREFSTRIEQDITSGGEALDAGTEASVKELSDKFDEYFKDHTANG